MSCLFICIVLSIQFVKYRSEERHKVSQQSALQCQRGQDIDCRYEESDGSGLYGD